MDVDALRGKKVRVAVTFRFRSGRGGSLYGRIRQWQGGSFIGDAARVWASTPTGTNLEIVRFSGFEVVAADRGITDFHDVWFTAVAEGMVTEHATSVEIYFGVVKRAGSALVLDLDSVQVYVLEETVFVADPLRRMVSTCSAAVPVAVRVPAALRHAEHGTLAYRWECVGLWTVVELYREGCCKLCWCRSPRVTARSSSAWATGQSGAGNFGGSSAV